MARGKDEDNADKLGGFTCTQMINIAWVTHKAVLEAFYPDDEDVALVEEGKIKVLFKNQQSKLAIRTNRALLVQAAYLSVAESL